MDPEYPYTYCGHPCVPVALITGVLTVQVEGYSASNTVAFDSLTSLQQEATLDYLAKHNRTVIL